MKKTLSEKRALKRLGIPDWRHMSSDKIMEFMSTLQHMDPEIAKAAIAQFPNFFEMSSSMINVLSDNLVEKTLNCNNENEQRVYDLNNKALDILQSQLEVPDLSDECRNHIIDSIVEISQSISSNREKDRVFINSIVKSIAGVAGITIIASAALLGANFKISLGDEVPNEDDDNSDNDSNNDSDIYYIE